MRKTLLSFSLILLFVTLSYSQDGIEQPLTNKELPDAVELVRARIAANVGSIKTWCGDYTMTTFSVSGDDLPPPLANAKHRPVPKPPNAKIAEAFQGEFAFDHLNNSMFSTRRWVGSVAYKVDSAGDASTVNLPFDSREYLSVLTGIEFLHMDSKSRQIDREHRRKGEQRTRYADVFDPKQLLGHDSLSFDKMFTNFGLLLRKEARTSTFVGYKTTFDDTHQYRFVQTFASGLILECTVDSRYGFNATVYSMRLNETVPSDEVKLTYSSADGIYSPKSYHLVKYKGLGSVQHERQVDITSSQLNVLFANDAFSLQRLHPMRGDHLNDRIDNKELIYSGEKFITPDQFFGR